MNKRALLKKILAQLTGELEVYFRAANAAHAEATHEQNKAENKYDTRGLEASYLAHGQSKQAQETKAAIAAFEMLDARKFGVGEPIDLGALVELGASSELGVLTTSHVGRNIMGNATVFGAASSNWRRLETTFTRDFPDQNLTLRIGDTATRTGAWGRSSYFGGIQLARNFALTPGFITQPIPTITGQSSAPSTVELYINDALRQTSKVPTGPFAIVDHREQRLSVRNLFRRGS